MQLESLNQQLSQSNTRMTRDLEAAARIQRSLLPEAKLATEASLHGLAIHAMR